AMTTIVAGDEMRSATKRWKGIRWKRWSVTSPIVKPTNQKPSPDVDALLAKYGVALKPTNKMADKRTCVLCSVQGDGLTNGVARLLNLDVDQWVHLNCALWSAEVYETQGGALINVDIAVNHGRNVVCAYCMKKGATVHCNRMRCTNTYHCACALLCDCRFYKDKTVLCPLHIVGAGGIPLLTQGEHLKTLAVFRKVYVQRQETKQMASIMQQGEFTQGEKNYVLRVGALMLQAVGQLSTHQMALFHSKSAIYPNTRKRCIYESWIGEKDGKPWFATSYSTGSIGEITMCGHDVNEGWTELLNNLSNLRAQQRMLKLFPKYLTGENLFGLTAPVVARILESLPNIELCANYKFRFGRSPVLELPLAVNPTGSARSEPHVKHNRKKPHTLISNLISEYYESTGIADAASSIYGKHFVHSKSSQYRRMKLDWRNNPGTMVIEYIGDIIRSEVAEKREKQYEAANRGVYMFRLDSDYIVDATVTGGPARYINHSCNPNCVAEVVNFEKEKKIMIISNRHILSGEELNYDYKFDFEEEGNKIPCLCGALNCRKWMN
uniref:[histone H3]-lysine(4) N-methyltransferase n=1 Tax=Ciona savignyi TaxID=51511 RepID=H2Y448_CIOSA